MGLFSRSPAQKEQDALKDGMKAFRAERFDKALPLLLQAAGQGHADAACGCTMIYAYGLGRDKDLDKALYWAERAKECGLTAADQLITMVRAMGYMEEKNYAAALEQYEICAQFGDPKAMCSCGELYLRGEGLAHDPAKALQWFEKAAERGNVDAQFQCGKLYYDGVGTAADRAKARQWWRKAALKGHQEAKRNLKDLPG